MLSEKKKVCRCDERGLVGGFQVVTCPKEENCCDLITLNKSIKSFDSSTKVLFLIFFVFWIISEKFSCQTLATLKWIFKANGKVALESRVT